MKLRRGEVVLVGIILVSLLLSLGCYWRFPDEIATGFAGKGWSIWSGWGSPRIVTDPDTEWMISYHHKLFGTFAFALLMSVLYMPYFAFARLKKRVDDERYKYYDRPLIVLFGWVLVFQVFIALWNFGYRWQLDWGKFVPVLFGVMFFLFGDIVVHARPEWFISWKTRATLNHEQIWKKTHQAGGKWIKIGACLLPIAFLFRTGCIGGILLLPLMFGFYYIPIYPIIASRRLKRVGGGKDDTE